MSDQAIKSFDFHHAQDEKPKHSLNITLVAENIRTPENIGMIMRLCEAFGVRKIYFSGENSVGLTTKVKRASRSTHKMIEFEFVTDVESKILELKGQNYRISAIEITPQSKSISSFKKPESKNLVLIVGSERFGISEKLLSFSDEAFHIPMYGNNSSINVVNALSIALYKITD